MGTGRIPLEELLRLPLFMNAVPDWSRERVAFYWNKTGRMELYALDLRTRQAEQVTHGELPRTISAGFVWSRDNQSVIFTKDNAGNEQHNLYRLEPATGKVTQLTDEPVGQKYPVEVAPDNRHISVASNRAGQMNLFALDMETGEWTQLTNFKAPASGGYWSPDGQWVLFNSNETAIVKNCDGYMVRADGSEIRKIFSVKDGAEDQVRHWHPGGELVSVVSDASGVRRTGLLHVARGEVRWLGSEGVEESPVGFSDNGRWLAAIRNKDAALSPVVYDVETGDELPLRLPPGVAGNASFVLDDRKLLVQQSSPNRRSELILYDLRLGTWEVLLPAEYGSIDPSLFVTDEHVWYPSSDGQMVPAILYKPRHIEPGQKLPALIDVHGGPTGQYFRGFNSQAQLLADRGFVVLQPNFRGSTGYGTAWREANLLDLGGGDLEDVAAGVPFLTGLGYVDPERIGVFGGSYGGYMTYIATTKKPDVFKAGVAIVGITDWLTLWDESMDHFKYYILTLLGDRVANQELYRDRSALTFAENLTAQLLMIHGLNDPRCPISQARVFRDRLVALGREEGKDFEYEEFAAGHGAFGDTETTIRILGRTIDYLERKLQA